MPYRRVLISASVLIASSVAVMQVTVTLDRFEQTKGFHLANATGFRVRKYNRTTSVFSGEGDMYQDFGDEYSFTLAVAYSRLGNNQFNEHPFKIPKDKVCNVLNGPYKEYQKYFLNHSNMPYVGDEWVCPFPKNHYWIKDLAPESGWVPPAVPTGYWRMTADLLDPNDELILQNVLYLHIERSMG